MNIGIFGGSFDPVHKGHLALAEAAQKKFQLDRIVFVPTRLSPFKKNKPPTTARHRLAMLRASLKTSPKIFLSCYEIRRKKIPSYSFETVRYFKEKFPHHSLYWILGADAFKNFFEWKNWRSILGHAVLIVARRAGERLPKIPRAKKNWAARIHVMNVHLPQVSSEEIRQGLKEKYLTLPAKRYIRQHRLYKRSLRERSGSF